MTLAPPRAIAPSSPGIPAVTVLVDRCAGCQECVVRCPTEALTMDVTRWVAVADGSSCVGCRQCERTCPFSAIVVHGPLVVSERRGARMVPPVNLEGDIGETRQGFASWDEALAEAARCLDCPDPTCVRGCPTHNDVPRFVRAIADHDLGEAHQVLRRTTVLPDVCSRVCDQALQCEGACTWSLAGGRPVAIGALERFVTDHMSVPPLEQSDGSGYGLDVGIVGSGPAGIAAAWGLVEAGARVTVYEKASVPGGLLGWGIPDFTLPSAIADRPWEQLLAAGVVLRCDSPISPEEVDRLADRHDAIVLAHGAGVPMTPPVPGVELDGVEDASTFLERAHRALTSGERLADLDAAGRSSTGGGGAVVLVLGAGNTAMDVARSARRLGARAVCVDWMDPRFAPVRPDELDEARAEGVEVRFNSTVVGLDGVDGRVRSARLATTRQERAGRRPEVLKGEVVCLEVDRVVLAMGYRMDRAMTASAESVPFKKVVEEYPDRRWLGSGILSSPAPAFARRQPVGRLALARESARVSAGFARAGRVWVAGDALVGPSTVVEAMAQGASAARAILRRRPHRPGTAPSLLAPPRRVVVVVDSPGGRTRSVAEALGGAFADAGAAVSVYRVQDAAPAVIVDADLLVVGTWTEGLVVANVGPSRAIRRWIAALPPLDGVRAVTFCTYGVAPKGTIAIMRRELGLRGARVVADAAFGPRGLGARAEAFAEDVRNLLWPVTASPGAGRVRAVAR